MKKFGFLLILSSFMTIMAGCGNSNPVAWSNVQGRTIINKFTVSGTTITPSPNNPFIDPNNALSSNVSVSGFNAASRTTLITLVKTAAPATSIPFQENITLSATPTFATYQTINNITGRNGLTGFAQTASALNSPFAGEEMLRNSEAALLKQGGSFVKPNTSKGVNAFINPAAPPTVGSTDTFWVNKDLSGNIAMDVNVTATCAYVGTNAYIYVDNSVYNAASVSVYNTLNMASVSAAFDAIYITDRATFGSEYKPGIDNDNHVTILISPAVNNYNTNGALGYFWGKDEFAATTGTGTYTDHSNQREMFYVVDIPGPGGVTPLWGDAAGAATNAKQGYAILAHEFQHMINFYHKAIVNNVAEDTWINEGLSMYAMQACGYGMPQGDANTATFVYNYLFQPEWYSLTNWTPANYGVSYLYMLYLVEQYGGAVGSPASQTMLTNMVANNLTGTAQIESVSGAGTFGTVFKNWAMANLLDGQVTNPLYNYQSININGGVYGGVALTGVNPYIWSTYPLVGGIPQPGWSALYQRLTNGNGGALNISLTSTNAVNNLEGIVIVQ